MPFSHWLQRRQRFRIAARKNIFSQKCTPFRYALPWFGYDVPLLPGGRAEGSDDTPDQEIREETHSVVMQMTKRSTFC
jgi:hypothetical protein